MSNVKPMSTPLAKHFELSIDHCLKTDVGVEYMSKVPYVSAVGCSMCVMVCTRPDLAHVVSQTCKFVSNPGKRH